MEEVQGSSHKTHLTQSNSNITQQMFYVQHHREKKQPFSFLAWCSDEEDLVLNFSRVPYTVNHALWSQGTFHQLKSVGRLRKSSGKVRIQHLLALV